MHHLHTLPACLQDRNFQDNAQFFQDCFEAGRRFKIMNPDKMRSEYGKLVYLLMDSSDSQLQGLLEFKCVRPLRTVHTLLEECGGLQMLQDPLVETATAEIVAGGCACIDAPYLSTGWLLCSPLHTSCQYAERCVSYSKAAPCSFVSSVRPVSFAHAMYTNQSKAFPAAEGMLQVCVCMALHVHISATCTATSADSCLPCRNYTITWVQWL